MIEPAMERHSIATVVSFLALAAAVLHSSPTIAEERAPTSGTAFVLVTADSITPRWKARAIQENVGLNLSGMDRLRLADTVTLKELDCLELELDCIVAGLRVRGVQILIRGFLEGQDLRIASYETWTGTEVARRSLKLGRGTSVTDFRHRVFRVIRPFTEIGGLLDQHPAPRPSAAGPAREGPPAVSEGALRRLAVIAVLLVFMFFAPSFIVRRSLPELRPWLAGVSIALPALLLLCIHWKLSPTPLVPARFSLIFTIFKFWLGGAAWASIVVIAHRFSFSSIRGLDRVSFFTIFPILRAWISVSLWKLLVFVLALLPFLATGMRVSNLLALSPSTAWTLAAPFSILLGCLWYLVWIAYLAAHLDDEFVIGHAVDRRRWDAEVRKYFTGYLRRLDVQVNERLLKRVNFLPGTVDTVLSYGGGIVRTRVVINEPMLRLALGHLPVEEKLEAGTGGFADFAGGLIRPKRRSRGKDDDEGWAFIERGRELFARFAPKRAPGKTTVRAQAGPAFNLHNANVLGYMIPAPSETEALAADNREDLDALGELLTAHYAQFQKDGDDSGYELDDSDPTDRDFLFGALLREQGVLDLRHQILGTFSLAIVHACRHLPMFVNRFIAFCKDIYAIGFSKYPDLLADSQAALNTGRNHLTQYLYFQLTGRERLLTIRADETLLYTTSRSILAEVAGMEPTKEDALPLKSTLRNRLVWLSEFFYTPLPHGSAGWMRQLTTGALAIGTLIIAHHFIHESLEYRAIYAARLEETRKKIIEQEKKKEETQNGEVPNGSH